MIVKDGQTYQSKEEVWDLGSLTVVKVQGKIRHYQGLSKDVDKMPHYCDTGSSCFLLDTGEMYQYLKETDTWYKL